MSSGCQLGPDQISGTSSNLVGMFLGGLVVQGHGLTLV